MGRKKKTTPKAFQVRVSANALQNIDEITGYLAFMKHTPLNAGKVGDAIYATIDRINSNPFAFRECAEIPTKAKIYRRAVCMSWSVIYRIVNPGIIILGIIHHSKQPAAFRALRKIK